MEKVFHQIFSMPANRAPAYSPALNFPPRRLNLHNAGNVFFKDLWINPMFKFLPGEADGLCKYTFDIVKRIL